MIKDKQVARWESDPNQFNYDARNGDIKVLNSRQLRNKAIQIKSKATNRATKSKMTRLINQTKRNPYLHRIDNVWTKGGTYGKETKTKSYYNNPEDLRMALRGQALTNFAKIYNKFSSEKIVTAKQAHVSVNDGGNKIGQADYIRYPKVNSKAYEEGINENYNDGVRDTINYVTHNYPIKIKNHVKQFKANLKGIDNDLRYTVVNKHMNSARRYSKKHKMSLKKAYAQKYGVGNDRLDLGPGANVVTPYQDGLHKFNADYKFMHNMNLAQPLTTQQTINYSQKKIKSINKYIKQQADILDSPLTSIYKSRDPKKVFKYASNQHHALTSANDPFLDYHHIMGEKAGYLAINQRAKNALKQGTVKKDSIYGTKKDVVSRGENDWQKTFPKDAHPKAYKKEYNKELKKNGMSNQLERDGKITANDNDTYHKYFKYRLAQDEEFIDRMDVPSGDGVTGSDMSYDEGQHLEKMLGSEPMGKDMNIVTNISNQTEDMYEKQKSQDFGQKVKQQIARQLEQGSQHQTHQNAFSSNIKKNATEPTPKNVDTQHHSKNRDRRIKQLRNRNNRQR